MNTISLTDLLEDKTPEVESPQTLSIKELVGETPRLQPEALELQGVIEEQQAEQPEPTQPTIPAALVPLNDNNFVDLEKILKEYDRPLIKEDFLADKRLMELVRTGLEARYRPGLGKEAYAAVSGLAGGATGGVLSGRSYRDMPDEDVFEIWQNWQRSFAGTQTVTTANELAYGLNADDDTRAKLGANYLLFDSMDNAFTGEGSWGEMFDAVWDYGRAAVWDPSTLVSFGVGRALTAGGGKVTGAAVRKLGTEALKKYVATGATSDAAKATLGAVVRGATYAAPDAVIEVGADMAYQNQLMITGAQENYNKAQTAFAAAGAMVIPALMAGGAAVKAMRDSPALRDSFLAYEDLDKVIATMSKEEAQKAVRDRTNVGAVISAVDENFGKIEGRNFLSWEEAKDTARAVVASNFEEMTDAEVMNAFKKHFWFGDPNAGTKGYYQALKDAGFVVHPKLLEDNKISGVFGQTITWLSDDVVERSMKNFEEASGRKLGIGYTADSLASAFIRDSSEAGTTLWISSTLDRLEKAGMRGKDALEAFGAKGETVKDPQRTAFALSVYKRLLTSHLATTGANVKGFSQLVSLNTAADFVTAGANMAQSAYYKTLGRDADKAALYANRGWGSALGALRRGVSVFSPDIEMAYAQKMFEMNPDIQAKLFRDIAGDSGTRQGVELFNLDPDNVLWKGADNFTKGAQILTMTRLQDELTKTWAFGNNVNQYIMREYGITPEDFFKRPDVELEMASDKFKTNVLEKAAYRTLRETASVNWSTLPAQNAFRSAARNIEALTNRTSVGFVIPFGSFLNTTIATMGDLSGVNAIRMLARQATGQEVDFVTQEGAELLGKAVVGWGVAAYGIPAAKERIEQGLAWNQEVQDDGSIQDRQFDWPNSTIRLFQQVVAHGMGDSTDIRDFDRANVPDDLWAELGIQLGGQAVRDLDDSYQTLVQAINNFHAGEGFAESGMAILGPMVSKVLQGATRPFDPLNVAAGIARDGNMNPDLRQGPENFNNAMKYLNQLLPSISKVDDLPRRATAVEGFEDRTDVGKQMLGVRGLRENTLAETMFNSAGIPSWKAIKWNGPAEVKNQMDAIAAPIFEGQARIFLSKNPNYYTLPLDKKEKILAEMRNAVREQVMQVVENGLPESLNMLRLLSGADKDKVRRVKDFLGIEGDLESLLEQEDGLDIMRKIKMMVDSYDQIFYGDLELK